MSELEKEIKKPMQQLLKVLTEAIDAKPTQEQREGFAIQLDFAIGKLNQVIERIANN